MSDYEIIGRITVWLGAISMGIVFLFLIQFFAWKLFKEFYGWPRILQAMALLREHEKAHGINQKEK